MAIIIGIIFILLRPIGAVYCSKKANEKNRDVSLWVILALFFPVISMIIISFLKKKVLWHN
jgi:hypothetical protein